MRGVRHGRSDRFAKAGIAAMALAAALSAPGARAQYYDDRPPSYYGEERVYRAPRRAPPREPAGLNCAAVQQGLTGPQPYSCPLPGPRPLGARCFCDLPIASFSPPQTAVGQVVP
ncbi:hypothetical protein Q8W71_08040 [Methylobacterium sp. NEAU 140]|uniref:hypothetical protein n=1 Tax=Methylobacterium sp. NEAU 140 TaxID=3064945 RepID=UPI002734A626|nr:hypothetical protein [Methylobacterium sp. NEAU 140]MDP4022567.1 hypothetical protein [Methylobacterium sp. NEAU 140]